MKSVIVVLIGFVLLPLAAYGQVPSNDLVAYYPFNGNANDESGNGNHGTVSSPTPPTPAPDRFGNPNSAYEFNGASYIDMGNTLNLGNTGSISVWYRPPSYWPDPTSSREYSVLITKGGSETPGNDAAYSIYVELRGDAVGLLGPNQSQMRSAVNAIQPGQWHHIAYVFDASTHAIYVDGTKVNEAPHGITPQDDPDPFYVGRWPIEHPGGSSAIGIIDDVRIYDRALTSDEVEALFATDTDGDGVLDQDDLCPDTVIPESVPTVRLGTNRWALVDDDFDFDTKKPKGKGPGRSYTTTDTGGCSCEQIIAEQGLGQGHTKHGCSISAMDDWVAIVEGSGKRGDDEHTPEVQAEDPTEFVLEGAYPNPFNPQTTIRFSVPESAQVKLVVYDVLGRQVRVLVDGTRAAGTHEVVFEAGGLPSGTYLVRLVTPAGSFVQTIQLVK